MIQENQLQTVGDPKKAVYKPLTPPPFLSNNESSPLLRKNESTPLFKNHGNSSFLTRNGSTPFL